MTTLYPELMESLTDEGLEKQAWESQDYTIRDGKLFKKKASVEKTTKATFSPAMDKSPLLKGKQSKLPDSIQSAILKKKLKKKASEKRTTKTANLARMSALQRRGMSPRAAMQAAYPGRAGMGGIGMPGYSKGGPVKKDGYLTDKKGKPYARVHKGERVVPKQEKKASAPTETVDLLRKWLTSI